METVQSFLTYHAFEGGRLNLEYAIEILIDAIDCGLICDAQSINQIDIVFEIEVANRRADFMTYD